LAVPAVRSAIGAEIGRRIEHHERIASTQDRALELADAGEGRAVVVADEQTAGRGTRERRWLAPPGTALLASWVFRPAPARPALFTLLAGVALARALDRLESVEASLKWPNDVVVRGRKLAGALAHATTGERGALVLGVGVNVHQRAEELAGELRETATSLALEGGPVDRLALLAALTRELDRLAGSEAERAAGLEEWRRRSAVLGREVSVARPGSPPLAGIARLVDDDGALLLETAYGPERILAGEVSIKR
ncbi:MAG TPA: biotin--[acetyl-CoA-carboxylase] ligase, partial [Candidatus Limnocylindrales bacterium]|nr:biotin--[acetyl-CoA-carboxylase] ligase [Candidatus Limnocylindrales bacterium]